MDEGSWPGGLTAHGSEQPRFGEVPVILHGARGHGEDFRRLPDRETAEVAQFDDLAEPRIDLLEPPEGVVEHQQPAEVLVQDKHALAQRYPGHASPAFLSIPPAGVIHQNLTHGSSCDPEEVGSILPGDIRFSKPEVGLVDEIRGLNGLSRAFPGKIRRGDLPELVVHEWKELVQGGLVSCPNIDEKLCYFTGRRALKEEAEYVLF
jgi:hypothetical protein